MIQKKHIFLKTCHFKLKWWKRVIDIILCRVVNGGRYFPRHYLLYCFYTYEIFSVLMFANIEMSQIMTCHKYWGVTKTWKFFIIIDIVNVYWEKNCEDDIFSVQIRQKILRQINIFCIFALHVLKLFKTWW